MDLLKPVDLAGFASGDRALMLASWANAKIRRIAPCFQGSPDQDVIDEALPIAVQALERTARTEGWVASQTEGPRSITYRHLESAVLFTPAEEAELKALCGSAKIAGLPVGRFPAPPRVAHVFERGVR